MRRLVLIAMELLTSSASVMLPSMRDDYASIAQALLSIMARFALSPVVLTCRHLLLLGESCPVHRLP